MKIRFTKQNESYRIQFIQSLFKKLTYSEKKFMNLYEKGADFFEKRTYDADLRCTHIKINKKKYLFYEEKRKKGLIGVIEFKKMKLTWAFLCYIKEQLQDFLRSEEKSNEIKLDSY